MSKSETPSTPYRETVELSLREAEFLRRATEYGLATLQRAIDQAEGMKRQVEREGLVGVTHEALDRLPHWHEERKMATLLHRRISKLETSLTFAENQRKNGNPNQDDDEIPGSTEGPGA